MKRRHIMQAAAIGASTVAFGQTAASGKAGRTAIVIGTGFGGAVAAYRLGRAGFSTTVLERGSPHPGRDTSLLGFDVSHAKAGLLSKHRGDGIDVISAAGVGGGALIPGMQLSQPRRAEWERLYPAEIGYDLMDTVYWPRARASRDLLQNVAVHPWHEVTEIREASTGFEVRCTRVDDQSTRTFRADYVFLAAGAVNTTALLVTARAKGWLPRLRDEVGKGFGNNGEFLFARLNQRAGAELRTESNVYAAAGVAVPKWAGRTTAHLVVSMAEERGEIRYDNISGTGKVYWPFGVMETAAEKAGRAAATKLWWENDGKHGHLFSGVPDYSRSSGHGFGAANTWSPLGGMVMGRATDFAGRSLDYPNLVCVDGSVLPGSTGLAQPALTIAANAERCLDMFLKGLLPTAE